MIHCPIYIPFFQVYYISFPFACDTYKCYYIVMLFNSLSFIIFFIIAYFVYLIIPKKARKIFLLIASYFFYMCWNPIYILLLIGSTVVTFLCGLLLDKYGKPVLVLSLVLNFGLLFVFKYLDFSYEIVSKACGIFGLALPSFTSNLLLPVGISFYIFQAVGYTIDVYRKEVEPERNLLTYALFVSFFPQLVAGPIERSKRLLTQIRNLDTLSVYDFEKIQSGFVTALYGFFLKMVIADRAAIYVDNVYAVETFSGNFGTPVIFAIILFSLQIYCDFAGYTYIAIGAARMMGIDLCVNFRQPYGAINVKDFWDRWHISLSTYFRDYLYFPLGGSRKGKIRKYVNLLIVFLVSGLWHGASLHYVVWGGIHGIGRVMGEITTPIRKRIGDKLEHFGLADFSALSYGLWQRFFTFGFVSLAWVFFRCKSTRMALTVIKNAFSVYNPWMLTDGTLFNYGLDAKGWNILILATALLLLTDILRYRNVDLITVFLKQNPLFKVLFVVTVIGFIMLSGIYGPAYNSSQFIYFQF